MIEEWVTRYNGPGNDSDKASAIGIDASGNVYVTGYSVGVGTGRDYATIKYDPNGNPSSTWPDVGFGVGVRRYNGPGNDRDGASRIVLDQFGNIYVTGGSVGSGTGGDYATIKYDAAGNELWVARYDGPPSGGDGAGAIAIDGSGNVYVTGSSDGATGADYGTIRYDPNGNPSSTWPDVGFGVGVRRYNGPGNSLDDAGSLVRDQFGNVYVTGGSIGSGTGRDYATIKYDAAGSELWVARYNGPGNDHDNARAVAVDASGNIYVAGLSWGSGTFYDYATIKYDPSGDPSSTWPDVGFGVGVRRYNGPVNRDDAANTVAVDEAGNVYVTGYSVGGLHFDVATIKYDAAGDQVWVRRYEGEADGNDSGRAIALDAVGNVYVTGLSNVVWGEDRDYVTIKYDPVGNERWVARYNGPASGRDSANAMAIDDFGNVYVTGESPGADTGYDYATIKYSQVCPADLDADGDVDLSDLAQLLANYGTTEGASYEDGDLDFDGDVDLSDLAELLANYGAHCW